MWDDCNINFDVWPSKRMLPWGLIIGTGVIVTLFIVAILMVVY